MLPSVLAKQLEKGLSDYIETTFPMTTPAFRGSLHEMIHTPGAVFHDPYIALRLPFRTAEAIPNYFQSVHPRFAPWVHQQKAYERLLGDDGRSTLISTGTGSGKTECFLYPILEYCYRNRGKKGIKALIIYPMNALASDQAGRIAREIYNSPELRSNVTAGMYVGGQEAEPSTGMSKERIITDHEAMLTRPPDILLTNYKMLDYLLVRPKDAALWQENRPDTLKYIAVDELHTFDGAQGTDLACLLRRLKARLFTPQGFLCCIGTSATMGAKDSAVKIRDYAEKVFGEEFEDDAVITEDRLSASEFLTDQAIENFTFPENAQIETLKKLVDQDNEGAYLASAAECWLGKTWDKESVQTDAVRIEIAGLLLHHSFTQSLLEVMQNDYWQENTILLSLQSRYPQLMQIKDPSAALDALIALISHARSGSEGNTRPFLTVQVQLWLRELRRILARVTPREITYMLSSDLNEKQNQRYLPVVNCRDCGATGWVSVANERGNLTINNLNTFYNLFFKQDSKVVMVFPCRADAVPTGLTPARLCPECLQLTLGQHSDNLCENCGVETFSVGFTAKLDTLFGQYVCPCCGSSRGIALMGLRSATAISACLSQMFSTPFNDDKKTLAFSDNVQDAAHRAGFFNSRTWRSGLRTAIQHYALDQGNGLSLSKFSDGFISYWHERMSDEQFVSFFIAPNIAWMRAYDQMIANGRLGTDHDAQKLKQDISSRLRYEIMLEFGLQGRIGRTLEKTNCSVLCFSSEKIRTAAENIKERTINELGSCSSMQREAFETMTAGFLHLMRANGAFNDPIFKYFLAEKGSTYNLSNDWISWLPGLQSGRNTPRFISEKFFNGRRAFDFDSISGNTKYTRWIQDCITDGVLWSETTFEEIAKIVVDELNKTGIIVQIEGNPGSKIWAVDKAQAYISTNVRQFVCDECGTRLSVADENAEFFTNAPCMRQKCSGHLQPDTAIHDDYFGKLYSSGDLQRIAAREHTGLLSRDDREKLETDFKNLDAKKTPWVPNLLSCTPTLEMGIDIGDLSTVILCSIPPGQAQFLQRSGRAGRKNGNALTLAVANTRPHDLYYYTDPMEMISGAVEPPMVFLQAPAVLERQFVAYCMDSWIRSGVREDVIPRRVNTCLSKLSDPASNVFPFNFLVYVQNHLSGLIRSFVQMFASELDDSSIADLTQFAQGDRLKESPMHIKVLEAFENLKKQRDALTASIRQLKSMIQELEAKPKDSAYEEEIEELTSEKKALASVVTAINGKNVFNFLSDEGLLPNYAFPEAGIILKAVLYRKGIGQETSTARKGEKLVYEYNRSASSAISEFAPMNKFYVDGHQLMIDQVDLTTAQSERWRLCPNCSHAQLEETGKAAASCPKCSSPAWADSGQIRSMLKVQMVYSTADYAKSLIADESDDRSTVFYCKQTLVDVDEDHDIVKAYQMDNDEFSFGYEFVSKASIREINFGESDIQGDRMSVSGVDEVRKGFKICKFCGKIQPDKGKPVHSYTCKAKNPMNGMVEPYEECLFLYRELETEALRLLIPATTMDSTSVRQESFIAAIMLGLKEYFGNVDHLRACLSEVPVKEQAFRKQYLVIYDSIPGGTGYLKQLMLHENALIDVLSAALEVMEHCQCKDDPQKDGCYHCLFAYRQSQKIGQISRNAAMELLRKILSGKDSIVEIPKLDSVPVNPLFESELERKFVEAIAQMGTDARRIEISKALVNNKEGYSLHIGSQLWEIEPQVEMTRQEGVSIKTVPDFVLRPARNSSGQKPVAIFTDGFQVHKDKTDGDSLKREAIRRAGKYRVWVLSWKDVEDVFVRQGDYAAPTLQHQFMPGASWYYRIVEAFHAGEIHPDSERTFGLLINYLENPEAENLFAAQAQAYAFSLVSAASIHDPDAFTDWQKACQQIFEMFPDFETDFQAGSTIFGSYCPSQSISGPLKIFAGVKAADLKENNTKAVVSVAAILDDDLQKQGDSYASEWNGFWQFFNLMQFLPRFAAVTTRGLEAHLYEAIGESVPIAVVSGQNDEWAEMREMMLPEVQPIFDEMLTAGFPLPSDVGFELIDSEGTVIGQAEIVWEAVKVAYLLSDQSQFQTVFEKNGWKVISSVSGCNKTIFEKEN